VDIMKKVRPSLDEEGLSQDAPYVRALIAMRYEQLWQVCQDHIRARGDAEMEPDVRFVEAGHRILKAQSSLYRLDSPTGTPDEVVGGTHVDLVSVAAGALAELEARMAQDQ
jgi:hypothetical protein